jgi:hypothetical protein
MLELLEQLYLHRIAHLNKFAIRQAVTQVNPDYSIPTKQEISAYITPPTTPETVVNNAVCV